MLATLRQPRLFRGAARYPDNGRWRIAPAETRRVRRQYRPGTLVLETMFETRSGSVALIDFMPARRRNPSVVRLVEGRTGTVAMRMDLALRFDYGSSVPWVTHVAGRHRLARDCRSGSSWYCKAGAQLRGEKLTTVGEFTIAAGERVPFILSHGHRIWRTRAARWPRPHWMISMPAGVVVGALPLSGRVARSGRALAADAEGADLLAHRRHRCRADHFVAGAASAASETGTTASAGCATRRFTLLALIHAGYRDEAQSWREWLRRASLARRRRFRSSTGWPASAAEGVGGAVAAPATGSRPVRIGNAASAQLQLDVYGELMDALYQALHLGLARPNASWALQRAAGRASGDDLGATRRGHLGGARRPRHFTFSKVMAWVAFDRAVKVAEQFGLEGPVEHWRGCASTIHGEVCREGFNAAKGASCRATAPRSWTPACC